MKLALSTLRPGLLVSLKTSKQGNVRYDKIDLDEHAEETGEAVAKWETTRTIADPREFETASKVIAKAAAVIRRVCSVSAFGLLCPEDQAENLERAISEAQAMVSEFNSTASLTRLHLYVIAGRIAQDDVTAVRAINSEVRELMEDMAEGVRNMDVKAIRAAATTARQLGQMLSPDAQARVQIAVDSARTVAKNIVAAGEAAALQVDAFAIRQITSQRTAFLDMSDEVEIARPKAEGRALDFAPGE